MARHLFDVKLGVQSPKSSVTVYTDAACTQVADIQTAAGVAISGAVVAVGLDRHLAFLGPLGVRRVYVKPTTDPSVVVQLDTTDSGLATDAELEDGASADSATYAPITTTKRKGAWALGLTTQLRQALWSCGLGVVTDSTGVGSTRWPRLLAALIAADFPAWTVATTDYNPASSAFDAPVVAQVGTAGQRYASLSGVSIKHPGDGTSIGAGASHVIDIRCQVQPTGTWANGTAQQVLLAQWGGQTANKISFRLSLNSDGRILFEYSADGSTLSGQSGPGPSVPFGSGVQGWVRATFDPTTGALNVYTAPATTAGKNSDNVASWTQLGTTVTLATAAGGLYDAGASAMYEVGARFGSAEPFTGKVYTAEIRVGQNGRNITDFLIDQWYPHNQSPYATYGGAPLLMIVNGSRTGSTINDLYTYAITSKELAPLYGQTATVVSCSHNDTLRRGAEYFADYMALVTALKTRYAQSAFALSSQNPRTGPATFINEHADRRSKLAAMCDRNDASFVDVHGAFLADGRTMAGTLVQSDGIHPTDAAGSPLWAATIYADITAASAA